MLLQLSDISKNMLKINVSLDCSDKKIVCK